MARLLGPDMGSRYAYLASGAPAASLTAVVYANSAGTILADIATYDGSETPAGAIANSQVTTDANGLLPLFWFPDDIVDRLWVSVNGGALTPIDADNNRRLDGPLALNISSDGAYAANPVWESGRAYRDAAANKDGIFYVENFVDDSGTASPITYSKMFGGEGLKTGPGNMDAHWASVDHYGPGEVGLFIGDVTAMVGGSGGNIWGGHFRLIAAVAANMMGLHIDLQPNASVVGKQSIGIMISNNNAANHTQQALRILGQWDNPIIVYSDNAGTTPIWFVDLTGAMKLAGRIHMGTGATAPTISSGSGSPEGVVTANVGSLYTNTAGGAGTTLYVKQSGTGNTGWARANTTYP